MKVLSWLNDIKFRSKMALIGLFALSSVALPTYFFVVLSFESEAFAELELKGIKPATVVVNLMKNIAQHRGISARYLAGDSGLSSRLNETSEEVNKLLASFSKTVDPVVSNELISNSIAKMSVSFQSLANNVQTNNISGSESFEQHSNLILICDKIISSLMQNSGLSYDPVAESYHLIIASFENLPRLVEALGKIRGFGSSLLTKAKASDSDRARLSLLISEAYHPSTDFLGNLNAVVANNPTFSSKNDIAEALFENVNRLSEKTKREIINVDSLSYSSESYFKEYTQLIGEHYKFFEVSTNLLEKIISDRVDEITSSRNTSLSIIIGLLALGFAVGVLVVRSINRSIKSLTSSAEGITAGSYDHDFDVDRKDELGLLSNSLANMSSQLKQAAVVAEESLRIRQALDNTSTNVMIADTDRNIIYLNRSVEKMLRESESDIQKVLPHFEAGAILGSNMDIFHKNPAHQKDLLTSLKSSYQAQIKVGVRHFELIANPIYSKDDERLGSIVEWSDRTLEVQAEEDVSKLVDAAVRGDFSERAQTEGKSGFMLKIAESLNTLIDITESGLTDVANVLKTISDGDLTQQIEKEYLGTFNDLKNYTNQTSNYLADMIGEIREAADTISGASSEIAQGNSDLSSRTEEQASSLEETASSMEELTGTVRLNAENANQANGLASKASGVAVEGGELIGQVVETMASINESAQKISDIIGVIDGIAFQTNILALNAAVEAARAGEQGRGFAVVASEVRTLAQRSANAAKDIKGLISDSVSKIDSGNTLVNRSGETMQEIVTAIKRVNDIMSEIAAASAEQASGIDEVGKAITQMDEVTQQNAALVEEAAAAAESMQSQAEQLSARVSTFKIDENDTQRTSKLPPPQNKRNQPKNDKPTIKRIVKPSDPDEDEWESF